MSPIRPLVRDLIRGPVRDPLERRGGWTPRALFAAGEQGAWYDFSDFSTLFQDSAGTTPGAVGQPLGLVLDKSGRGNNALQATTTSRPGLVNPSGSLIAARADGVDDSLASATGGGGTAGILVCAAVTVNGGAATERRLWADHGSLTGYMVRISTVETLQLLAGDGVANTTVSTAATLPAGTHVVTLWDDGVNLNAQVDNGVVASTARPVVSAGSAGFTMFKSNTVAANFLPCDCHALVYVKDTAKTAAERQLLKSWVARKAGLSL